MQSAWASKTSGRSVRQERRASGFPRAVVLCTWFAFPSPILLSSLFIFRYRLERLTARHASEHSLVSS